MCTPQGDTMTRKWNLPLTYQPKIQPVIDGTIRQTIRIVNPGKPKKEEGDLIRFYMWTEKPYRSPRITITEYMPLTVVKDCRIMSMGIDNLKFQGEYGLWEWNELDRLAEFDGIIPPTGEALRDVLFGKDGIPDPAIEAQVLRW